MAAFGLILLCQSLAVAAEPVSRSHVVYDGQRLGSIAKRYGVSVEAICGANDMRPTDRLKPGQRLVIPNRGDRDGSRARAANSSMTRRRSATEPQDGGPATHRVESGQRLESIARRYGVKVE
ncbi:MAG TPA: LysM peptidoglycan-binding domain-containing protein, partial [Polyangiaceae bacterium]|nr:LysM peptidoglycan-binding domain-containing protein [Polyangiaceae bacterium]